MKNKSALLAAILAVLPAPLRAAPAYHFALRDAETAAAAHSPRVQAARAEFEAAAAKSKSQFASLLPKISFDASYRYVTEVPVFSPVPNGPKTRFGDNESYSYGPAANWLLWDSGGVYNRWKSAAARARAKQNDHAFAVRQIALETRLNYFQTQLGLEQVRLISESLNLAQAQYEDIRLRQRAGVSSRIDTLASHQEVLNRRRQLLQAQADLNNAFDMLFAVTGSTLPMPVSLDPLAVSAAALAPAAEKKFDTNHPQANSLAEQVEAAERTAKSVRSGHYPFINVYGKVTRDYPNGPVQESINQKTLGVSASLPLFEFGRVKNDAAEQENLAEAVRRRRDQTVEDLARDWQKARDQWLGLSAQQEIYRQSISETETLQKLTYESYQAGRSTYLEVQTANLRVLESKVASARNDAQLLIQLAILDSLSIKE